MSCCCDDPGGEHVFAETPESAARKWLHLISPAERTATVRVVVSAPEVEHKSYPVYRGPSIEYERANGRLEVIG